MATDNELDSLFGQAPNDLGLKIQQGLQDAWKKHVIEQRENTFSQNNTWDPVLMYSFIKPVTFYIISLYLLIYLSWDKFTDNFLVQFFGIVYLILAVSFWGSILYLYIYFLMKYFNISDPFLKFIQFLQQRKKVKIINGPITSLPRPDFIFNFARENGIKIIDSHIQTFQDNSSKLRNHKYKLQSDLREAQRLYAGDLNTSEYLAIQKILHSKMTKIDQEVERIPLFVKRLEDFKDEVYRRTKMIMAKQDRLAFFEKISKDNTEEMVIEMKTQQQLAVQELEESFTVLLSMMNDAQHYIDAKQEVEQRLLD